MGPIGQAETAKIVASLTDLVPFLSPAKTIIELISQALNEAKDNENQCFYLMQRSSDICLHMNKLCKEKKISEKTEHVASFLK
jgi:hypothetical protein